MEKEFTIFTAINAVLNKLQTKKEQANILEKEKHKILKFKDWRKKKQLSQFKSPGVYTIERDVSTISDTVNFWQQFKIKTSSEKEEMFNMDDGENN